MDNNAVDFSKELVDLIVQAENRAKQFKSDGLKTNQIRNFYSAIARMRTDFEVERVDTDDREVRTFSKSIENKLVMLRPKLAYAAGRQNAVRANFFHYMTSAIDNLLESKRDATSLEKFFAIVESVVAYHKFHGGE